MCLNRFFVDGDQIKSLRKFHTLQPRETECIEEILTEDEIVGLLFGDALDFL
jgi:hypothetical protein